MTAIDRPAGPSRRSILVGGLAAMLPPAFLHGHAAAAQTADAATRQVPARTLHVPDTISDALKPVVGAPPPPNWNDIPTTAEGWKALTQASTQGAEPILNQIKSDLGVTVEESTIAGVHVYISTPNDMPEANRNRTLMHLHGGGYVLFPGEVGAGEGMMMAGYGKFRVVSVDYRMPPDFPFPAALDDAMAVWKALLAENDAARMAIFGTSAGGGLTMAAVLKAKMDGVPLPAAIAPGSPWTDLTGDGDSEQTNQFVDNAIVSNTGWVGGAATLYANGHGLKEPLISPLYGDFAGLPPAILTSGTRDLLLSDTVRTHRKLRQAGVVASLQVFEAQSHAQFLTPFVPETAEAFGEIAAFLSAHMAA